VLVFYFSLQSIFSKIYILIALTLYYITYTKYFQWLEMMFNQCQRKKSLKKPKTVGQDSDQKWFFIASLILVLLSKHRSYLQFYLLFIRSYSNPTDFMIPEWSSIQWRWFRSKTFFRSHHCFIIIIRNLSCLGLSFHLVGFYFMSWFSNICWCLKNAFLFKRSSSWT